MREQEHGGRASIVADMITCLDLSYGKNKTSISPYLPFNQIPTFFCLPATKLSQAENKPFPYQRAMGSIDFQARRIFIQKL